MSEQLAGLLDLLKPGQRVFIQGGPGECVALIDLLKANPGAARGVELWSCLVPGINTFDYGSLPDGPNVVTFMASPARAPSIATGRTRIDAMPYSEIGATLARTVFDVAILHAAPPRADGLCSFGVSCEAALLVWPKAGMRVALLNEKMPSFPISDGIHMKAIELAIPIDAPLLSPKADSTRSAALDAIARHAAALVPNDATIQWGIGEAPRAIVAALTGHRDLRIHSGLVTPELRMLSEAGALAPGGWCLSGIAWGGTDFYDWLKDAPRTAFRSMNITHGANIVPHLADFVSIGSALEVDLEGNINLEWLDGKRVSSVGGAPDFMRGAAASAGGLSVIAMPSASRSGRSRIVPRLQHISIAADLADAIVTEHGVARLRGLDRQERARALIRISAPDHREALSASIRS
jgi:acyl-CoA hydrolase